MPHIDALGHQDRQEPSEDELPGFRRIFECVVPPEPASATLRSPCRHWQPRVRRGLEVVHRSDPAERRALQTVGPYCLLSWDPPPHQVHATTVASPAASQRPDTEQGSAPKTSTGFRTTGYGSHKGAGYRRRRTGNAGGWPPATWPAGCPQRGSAPCRALVKRDGERLTTSFASCVSTDRYRWNERWSAPIHDGLQFF